MKLLSPFFDQEGKAAIIGIKEGRTYTAFVVHGKDAARHVIVRNATGDGSEWKMLSLVENSPLAGTSVLETEIVDGGSAEIVQEALSTFEEFARRNASIDETDEETALAGIQLTFTRRGKKSGGILAYRDPERKSHVFAFCAKRQARKHVRQHLIWLDKDPCSAISQHVEKSDLHDRIPADDALPRHEVHITGDLATRIRLGLYLRTTATNL
ncbi:MAG: hypothetical protein WCO25_05310 [Candidatus Uhrbacteria bacterium]